MTESIHPRLHPEPEVLSAFAEGFLPEHERLECLAHVSECSRCRQIVFIAQPSEAATVPAPGAITAVPRLWRRFALLPAMGAAALALTVLTIATVIYRQPTAAVAPLAQTARSTPAPYVSPRAAEQAAQNSGAKAVSKAPGAASKVAVAVKQQRSVAIDSGSNPVAAAPNADTSAASANLDAQSRAVPPMSQGASLLPRPAPLQQSPPAARTDGIAPNPELPAKGRELKAAKKSDSTGFADTGDNGGPVRSRNFGDVTFNIEHQQSQVSSLSAVKGAVTDRAGSAIQGATVTIQQLAGGTMGTTATNANGEFTIEAVPPGKYELQVTSPGFQRSSGQFELQPQDLARVTSSLSVGSASQTVEVAGASAVVPTAAVTAEVSSNKARLLPSKLPVSLTVSSGNRALAVDSAGTLFFSRNGGKHWKAIKPPWPGKVTQLIGPAGSTLFRLTTDAGSVWTTQDGLHWRSEPVSANTAH